MPHIYELQKYLKHSIYNVFLVICKSVKWRMDEKKTHAQNKKQQQHDNEKTLHRRHMQTKEIVYVLHTGHRMNREKEKKTNSSVVFHFMKDWKYVNHTPSQIMK